MKPDSSGSPGTNAGSAELQSRTERSQLWSVVRHACACVAVLAVAVVLAFNQPAAKTALLIILFSFGFAYLIAPLVTQIRLRWRPVRAPIGPLRAALLVYLVLLVPGITGWFLAAGRFQNQIADFRDQIPTYTERAHRRLAMLERFADRFSPPEPLAADIRGISRTVFTWARVRATRVIEEIIASRPFLLWLWLVPVVALGLISRSAWFRDSAVARLPEGHLRWRGEEFFRHVNIVLAGYTRAQISSCLFVGTASAVGFLLLGVSHPLLLGVAAGLLEFLPVVGPLSLAIAAGSIVKDEQLIFLAAFLLVLRIVQDYLVYPWLVGRQMHLHPAAVVFATLAGAQAGGMLGILTAVPIVGISSIAVRHWREYWQIERAVREHGRPAESIRIERRNRGR